MLQRSIFSTGRQKRKRRRETNRDGATLAVESLACQMGPLTHRVHLELKQIGAAERRGRDGAALAVGELDFPNARRNFEQDRTHPASAQAEVWLVAKQGDNIELFQRRQSSLHKSG